MSAAPRPNRSTATLHRKLGMPDFREWSGVPRCADADPDAFFPEKGYSAKDALAICAQCDVREECLEYALAIPTTDDYGVWGGTTEQERALFRRAMGREGRRSEWAA